VRSVQGRPDLIDDPDRPGRLQWPIAENAFQIPTFDEPHVDIQPTVDFTELMDRHHMRLGKAGGGEGFPPEPLLELWVTS
jgi:hypothetical protein